jgi:hypothetical protein
MRTLPVALASLVALLSCSHLPAAEGGPAPAKATPAESAAALAAERERQERENDEAKAWKESRQRAEVGRGEADEARRAEVTRRGDLDQQKMEAEARARAEKEQGDRAAEAAKAEVARARATAAGASGRPVASRAAPGSSGPGAAPASPGSGEPLLARRRADPRWTRPGLSGQLCHLVAARDVTRKALAAADRRASRGDDTARARAAGLRHEARRLQAEALAARGRMRSLALQPLPCPEKRTAAVTRCFRALDAGRSCQAGPREMVEVVRSFDAGGQNPSGRPRP